MYASIILVELELLLKILQKLCVVGLHGHGLVLDCVEEVESLLSLLFHQILELVDLLLTFL